MSVIGVHTLLYTSEPDKLRVVLRDVLGWDHVDDGDGWLIFKLPPSEMGVHPAEGPTYEAGYRQQITFMCDDIAATIDELTSAGLEVDADVATEPFGLTTTLHLPGGAAVMLYEPRHARAIDL